MVQGDKHLILTLQQQKFTRSFYCLEDQLGIGLEPDTIVGRIMLTQTYCPSGLSCQQFCNKL